MPRARVTAYRSNRAATDADLATAQAELEAAAAQVQAQFRAALQAAANAQQQHTQSDNEEVEDMNGDQTEFMDDDDDEELIEIADESNLDAETTMEEQPSMLTEEGKPDPSLDDLKEIGNLASWTVSTAKPGCGVAALRNDDVEQFWQSDGPQPHFINIHFAKRVFVKRIRIYLDYILDESYTPTKMSILSGTGYHNLQEVTTMQFDQPHGWIDVDLRDVHEDGMLRTFLIQIGIHANHQNGKDTHVRGLQIFSPIRLTDPCITSLETGLSGATLGEKKEDPYTSFGFGPLGERVDEIPFSSNAFLSEMEIR